MSTKHYLGNTYFALLPVDKASRFRRYDYFIVEVIGEIVDEAIFQHVGSDSGGTTAMLRSEITPLTAAQCRKLRKTQVVNWPQRSIGGMKRILKMLANQDAQAQ